MNIHAKKEILNKYAFIKKCVPPSINIIKDIDKVLITNSNPSLLNKKPKEYYYEGSLGKIKKIEMISFVFSDNVLYDTVGKSTALDTDYIHSEEEMWDGETILEALNHISAFPKFIVVFYYYHSQNKNSNKNECTIEIYKMDIKSYK